MIALLDPRQVGKIILALEIADSMNKESEYLALEFDSNIAKIFDPEAYLRRFENK